MVAAEPVPGSVSEEVRHAYAELAGEAVAVRSSATAEDTESASFAGMNETFLNVRGADAVVDAVRRCWASLFGARTIFYRAKRGFGAGRHGHRRRRPAPDRVDARRRDVHDRPGHRRATTASSSRAPSASARRSSRAASRPTATSSTRRRCAIARARGPAQGARRSSHAPDGGTVDARARAATRRSRPVLDRRGGRRPGRARDRGSSEHYGSPQDTEWAFDPTARSGCCSRGR